MRKARLEATGEVSPFKGTAARPKADRQGPRDHGIQPETLPPDPKDRHVVRNELRYAATCLGVVYNSDSIVDSLRQKAARLLTEPPTMTEETLIAEKYRAATRFEDTLDLLAKDPIAANGCLSQAVMEIMR